MFHLIEDNKNLEELDQELLSLDFVAVDTEFRRQGKEDIRLSLIQVSSGEEIFIIDCILIGEYNKYCNFLSSKKVKKIFHSCREDLDALHSWTNEKVYNIFDTQLANEFLGGIYSIGYQDLVHKLFGVSIEKKETRSNWMKRPLKESQLNYAATDVQYLIKIYQSQLSELKVTSKIPWIEQELENYQFNDTLSNNYEDINKKVSIGRDEEEDLLKDLSKRVNRIAIDHQINSTMLLSKKSQRLFLKKIFKNGLDPALNDLNGWRKELLKPLFVELLARVS
tara:strand:- start:1114 stop:1953 length:840 start_codon:yes stop_codon:yes gene_type:complete